MKPRLPLLAAVCVAPRRTMRWLLDNPGHRGAFAVVLVAVVSMIVSDFNAGEAAKAAEALGVPVSLLVAVVMLLNVVILSLVIYYGFAAAAVVTGRMLGGTGTHRGVRAAVAWGLAPFVWALLYRVPAALFWPGVTGGPEPGLRIGKDDFVFTPVIINSEMVVFGVLEVAVMVWYLVVGSRALAEAQSFSSWRGLANLLMAVVLPFVGIAVIAAAAFLAFRTA